MSGAAIRWARAVRGIDPGPKLLLLLLADYADEAGSCFPGQQALAADSCQSERTVRRQLEALETAGLLTRERRSRTGEGRGRGGLTARYYLDLDAEDRPAKPPDRPAKPADRPAKSARPTGQIERTDRPNELTDRPTVAGTEDPLAVDPPARIHQQGTAPGDGIAAVRAARQRPSEADRFAEFYAAYPRHEKRLDAQRAWAVARRHATADEIIAGARRYAEDPNRDPTYTAHPGPWLRAGRWTDDPLPPREAAPVRKPTRVQQSWQAIANTQGDR